MVATVDHGVVDRLEIPKKIKLEVFKRAGGPGNLICEGCGLPIGGKVFHWDHTLAEVFQSKPKSERTITAEDVRLLGWECCHKPKTIKEIKANCHGKRIVAKAARANKPKWRPIIGSKASGYKFDWKTRRMVRRDHQ
jgi:hypothetical protein